MSHRRKSNRRNRAVQDADTEAASDPVPGRRTYGDAYTVTTVLLVLVVAFVRWRGYIRFHEAIYLLGPHRVATPEFLAKDFTWSTLPPTTFVFDHLLAPLWSVLGELAVIHLGRALAWVLFAWSLSMLARTLRLPPWSVVVGFAFWLLWGQSLGDCGSPIEGLQPKAFSYPLTFFAIVFAIRGQMIRAGLASGLATLFHIIIGGWGCLALALSMLVNRKLFSVRQLGTFLVSAGVLIAPLVLVVGLFHVGGVPGEERALMDEIYVKFAVPHCLDPAFYMRPQAWPQAGAVFLLAPLLIRLWPQKPASRVLADFILMVVAFAVLGFVAYWIDLFAFMKLYPIHLALSLPALFMTIFCLGYLGSSLPASKVGRGALALGLIVSAWLAYDRGALQYLVSQPARLAGSTTSRGAGGNRYGRSVPPESLRLYAWIRENTAPDSVFVTPYLPEFWTYAERAQVASLRHPPHDRKILEWKDRLVALNGFNRFAARGFFAAEELNVNESRLSVPDLFRMRRDYGATHYVTDIPRRELAARRVYASEVWFVYRLSDPGR